MRVKMPCPHGAEFLLRPLERNHALEVVPYDDVSINPAGVPDGGSTVSLLGCALLGVTVLRRKLRC